MTDVISQPKLTNLSILKILAALFIIFHHFQQLDKTTFEYINFYGGKFNFGLLVELFFIISGYFTAKSYFNNKNFNTVFILKKVLRLFPFALLSTLITFIFHYVYFFLNGSYLFDQQFNWKQISTSFLLINQGWIIEFFPAINNPTWYLCVLIWLLIVFVGLNLLSKKTNINPLYLYSGLIILGLIGLRQKWNLPFLFSHDCRGYIAFFLGVITFTITNKYSSKHIVKTNLLILVFVPIIYFFLRKQYYTILLFFTSLVSLSITSKEIIPNTKTINLLEASSFECYLWHVPLNYLLRIIADTYSFEIPKSFWVMIVFALIVETTSIYIYIYISNGLSTIVCKRLSKTKTIKTY